jgi:hypothetical protein
LISWIVFGLILLGIVYKFILPFTPVWLDVTVAIAVAVAFAIGVILSPHKGTTGDKDASR